MKENFLKVKFCLLNIYLYVVQWNVLVYLFKLYHNCKSNIKVKHDVSYYNV